MAIPHIAHVTIKNYRNFEYLDIDTDEKQLVLGENASGKSNYIKAIRLILDQSMSDQDRTLTEDDFSNTIKKPMENGVEIEISLYIDGYKDSPPLMCIIGDAIVSLKSRNFAKITYKFVPVDVKEPKKGYHYIIYKGNDVKNKFDAFCRRFLNVKVINALRDVDSDLMSVKRSPLHAILNKYKIDLENECYKDLFDAIQADNNKLLQIDEIADARNNIKANVDGVLKRYNNSQIDIGLSELNPNKLINLLRIFENGKNLSETSLGICNVIYIQLILQQIQNQPIPTFISKKFYENFEKEEKEIVEKYYDKTKEGNLIYKTIITDEKDKKIISDCLSKLDDTRNSTTFLLLEEPEAHLHPSFQRMIYKDIFTDSFTSIIMTSHSPHLASICPINYIVSFRRNSKNITVANTSYNAGLSTNEIKNLQRYIDVNRGEIFFGKGIILVEGISEEILVPVMAQKMSNDLDSKGIIICNINSTNFLPYIKLLIALNIPYVVITDGDPTCEENGAKRMEDLCREIYTKEILEKFSTWKMFFLSNGYFIGENTIEIDVMKAFKANGESLLLNEVFGNSTKGGDIQKKNFKSNYDNNDFDACLRTIESKNVGKGRFAQELAIAAFKKDSIPEYIKNAITKIYELV